MKSERNLLSGDWKRNWQQSIAVRISALALWVILPISLFITFFYISHLREDLQQQYVDKADLMAYRLQNYLEQHPLADNQALRTATTQIMEELTFSYLKLTAENKSYEFGKPDSESEVIHRHINTIPLGAANPMTINIGAQHPNLDLLIADQRNKILYPVVISLVLFGIFLLWAIRSMVHRPLEKLVDATQAVSDGIVDLRLDTNRQDEFGYIARFFNEMLDQLLEQQEKLKEAAEHANTANNAKSAFLANMSHELRTPLNAIIGYSDLLYERAVELEQEEFMQDLQQISTAGKFLLDLINNILDITKIESGRTEVYYEDIKIAQMINEIRATMTPLVSKNNNQLIIDIEPDITDFRSDYTKLRQSLFNLLSNACKFTEDGTISLKVAKQNFNGREKIIFEITDTGTGMSNECMTNLFIPFSRGRNSNALKISGTGLGLAISRHFCNLLDGEISVDSTLGIGTTFKIFIPYIPVETQANTVSASSVG